MSISPRRQSVGVNVGGVMVGGGAPVVVQSMTNTDTADIEATVRQVAQLWRAGSEIVRITVDRDEAAAAVPHIRDKLAQRGVNVPIVGDFHYIGHKLLTDHPAAAEALAKYRINPGNVGFKAKRDTQFATLIELAMIRLGRTFTAVAYVKPASAMTATQVDGLRLAVEQDLVRILKTAVLCEVIPTAIHPYPGATN